MVAVHGVKATVPLAIEDAAGKPAGAASALDTMAVGRDFAQRIEAAGGPAMRQDIQTGAQTGRKMLETARNVSPRTGSETALNAISSQSLDMAAQGLEAIAAAKTGGLSLVMKVGNFFRTMGMSEAEAGALVRMALDPDPAQLDAMLARLDANNPTATQRIRQALDDVRARAAATSAPIAAEANQ